MDTKGAAEASSPPAPAEPVETVVIEAGHGYVDLLDDEEVHIPGPDEEMIKAVQDFCEDYGIEYQLVHVADDTSSDLSAEQLDSKENTVDEYLEKWSKKPDQISWESEAAAVWEDEWYDHQDIEGVTGDSKNVPFTCAALDAAMTAEKLGETDYTSIPAADLAVTQHDENLPVPSIGGYSSFQGYDSQEKSHEIQEELYELGVLENPTWEQSANLEYNPGEKTPGELVEDLEEVVL